MALLLHGSSGFRLPRSWLLLDRLGGLLHLLLHLLRHLLLHRYLLCLLSLLHVGNLWLGGRKGGLVLRAGRRLLRQHRAAVLLLNGRNRLHWLVQRLLGHGLLAQWLCERLSHGRLAQRLLQLLAHGRLSQGLLSQGLLPQRGLAELLWVQRLCVQALRRHRL